MSDGGTPRSPTAAARRSGGASSGRRRWGLWAGFAAVLASLLVLLGLQWVWLVDLERSSTVARRATMAKYADLLLKEVQYVYASSAERSLNLPSYLLAKEKLEDVGIFFKKKRSGVARRYFVVSYLDGGRMLFWDPETHAMVEPELTDETIAVWAATTPWKFVAKKGAPLESVELNVDERDPNHRIVLNPITDESWRLVGLAGMVVDRDVFEREVLAKVVQSALPSLAQDDAPWVAVRDARGRRVFPECAPRQGVVPAAEKPLSFLFTDYVVEVGGVGRTPEQWARANFALNVSMSVVLAGVLVAGILLALRTALREMRLSSMKNEFVSNVSHELRTPLASIRVFGEFMRLGRVTDPGKVREYGEYIETESRRLTQLVNNILDFSRIESGRKEYSFELADLEEVVGDTLSALAVRVRTKGMEIGYRGPDEPLPPMQLDVAAIDQAVANLLDNAVKYSGDSDRIEVSMGRDDSHAVLSVTDHGIGIPRPEQERIFERFHRVGTALVHDVKGSGLGLSLVRHIVHAHGGEVTVDSEVGRGSTFTVRLPIRGEAT